MAPVVEPVAFCSNSSGRYDQPGLATKAAGPLDRGGLDAVMSYAFNFREIWAQQDFLIDGILVTLLLSAVTMLAGLVLGAIGATYVEVIRNTPLPVQLFITFFGLPSLGIRLDAMTASLIALSINLGAYSTEIIRAGLEAIPRAQVEAGHSLGLSGPQVFRYVVLPPAIEIVYPALTSQFVLLMLATSIVSQISAPDLFHVASIIQSRTFRDFEIYAVVAVVYLALALAFKLVFYAVGQLAFARR